MQLRFSSSSLTALLLVAPGAVSQKVLDPINQPSLGTYTPYTDVTDEALLDLDAESIEIAILDSNAGDKIDVTYVVGEIYMEGRPPQPFEVLNLDVGLFDALPAGTMVEGVDEEGTPIEAELLFENQRNSTKLHIKYDISSTRCRSPEPPTPDLSGCFAEENGTLTLGGREYTYTYDRSPHVSDRTFQSLSVDSTNHREYRNTTGQFHDNMELFVEYYGTPDYADRIIMGILTGENAGLDNGNMDFSGFSEQTKAVAALEGIVRLNVFMTILSQLSLSVELCFDAQESEGKDNSGSVNALDAAVAYYTGSMLQPGRDIGLMMYGVADAVCGATNTCGDDISNHNQFVLSAFLVLQYHVLQFECGEAEELANVLSRQLLVPLIQEVMEHAFRQDVLGVKDPTVKAVGAVYASSILPFLQVCDEFAAEVVYENMRPDNNKFVDFLDVKEALERTYNCFEIRCSMIGGMYDAEQGRYYDLAEPCVDKEEGVDDEVPEDDEFYDDNFDIALFTPAESAFVGIAAFLGTALLFYLGRFCLPYARRSFCSDSKEVITNTSEMEDDNAADLQVPGRSIL